MLERILESTRGRLPDLRSRSDELTRRAQEVPPPPSFRDALAGEGIAVIAEVKRRSPSRGDLAPDLDPGEVARRYASGGASAISVLTEPEFFAGSPADLTAVATTGLPVLRKDFILDPVQVWEAKVIGASALLLIVAALDDGELRRLLTEADDAGLDVLVEVHTDDEARRAVEAGSRIVGVNNRDLADFSVDLATAEKLAPLLVDAPLRVAESGVFSGADAARMADAGYDAVLVGEALVKASDPAALLYELRAGR
ncbi:MAG TPA: indole-3-glycerol phosphate synthase TrpC [Acidimicrobiia bacterium]|nr:indole-3-glycerol phosphate synthase TrpC [Acidimicrobiia bacterium]